ncbi:MAG: HD domain-containing protein [Candidatus Aenigmatarchaeota archaeon]
MIPIRKEIENFVTREFEQKKGQISLAHDLTHGRGVASFASLITKYLAKRYHIENSEYLAFLAEICGLLHDIKREATEELPHGPAGAEYIKNAEIKNLFLPEELEILYKVIYHHEESYDEISKRFEDFSIKIIAQAIGVADKLAEGSGPRALERRSFFVGKERVVSGDLKGKFKYPEESYLSVLGETIRRLYDINHAKKFSPEIMPIVDFLHPWQYEFYKGLLLSCEMDEVEATKYLHKRGFPKLEGALKRIDERHLNGLYFESKEFPQLTKTINELASTNIDDLKHSTHRLIMEYVCANSMDEVVRRYEQINLAEHEDGFFVRWMQGIISYRSGNLVKELEKKLEVML